MTHVRMNNQLHNEVRSPPAHDDRPGKGATIISLLSVPSHSPLLISSKLDEFPLAASWLGIGFGYAGMRPAAADKQHER